MEFSLSAWLAFAEALFFFLVISSLPGYIISRTLRASRYIAIAVSVPITCVLYSICGIILYRFKLPGSIPLILCSAIAVLIFVAILFCLNRLRKQPLRRMLIPAPYAHCGLSWKIGALYIIVGSLIVANFFLLNIGDPSNINQANDNVYHITRIVDMVQHGNYSMLDTSFYLNVVPDSQIISPATSFYPEAFHILVSLVSSITGIDESIAENAVIYGLTGIIYPLGFSVFMQIVFAKRRSVILFGALATCACVMYPIRPMVVNGFYPFATGLSMTPIALSCFVLFRRGLSRGALLQLSMLTLFVFFGLAFYHPCVFLAACAFVIPVIVMRLVPLWINTWKRVGASAPKKTIIAQIISIVFIGLIWIIVYKLPFMQAIVDFDWDTPTSFFGGLFSIVSMGLWLRLPATVLAFMVFVGFMAVACNKRTRWVAAIFAFVAFLYLCDVSGPRLIKHLAAGFWYTDPERLSAMVAIAAVPLTAVGLSISAHLLKKLVCFVLPSSEKVSNTAQTSIVVCCLLLAFCAVNFAPSYYGYGQQTSTPFGATVPDIRFFFNGDKSIAYSHEKKEFVQQVKKTVPNQALIINIPYDGSSFSHPLDGVNTLYRGISYPYAETEESIILREHLNEIGANNDVSNAIKTLGAQYVMILENNILSESVGGHRITPFSDCIINEWIGLLQITDETPGLELVLSEGNMRLYKISDGLLEN